ncbi:MAG: glycosyltransferase [Rhodospirillales bacterium]|nr:glycosyltransferase [Rhodospirillales bacterium]
MEMQPQNIVAVITHDDQGGAQEALCRLCRALVQRGHSVRLWYLYKRGVLTNTSFPHQFILNRSRLSLKEYSMLPFLFRKMLLNERPTVVISFLPLANIICQTVGSFLRIPVRIASQRNPVQTYSWPMKILDWYLGTVGCYTDNVLNSSDVGQSIRNYPWPYRYRARIIHNGIEPISFDDMSRDEARSRFQIDPTETALVSVGRLTKQKNHAFLVQILGALHGFRLLLAGVGSELERLRIEAQRMGVADRVTFLGALDQPAIKQLLHAADILRCHLSMRDKAMRSSRRYRPAKRSLRATYPAIAKPSSVQPLRLALFCR